MPDCPDDTELAGFLNDSLGAARGAAVSGHVDGCPHCQARLDRLTEHSRGAAARYGGLSSGSFPDAASGHLPGADGDTQVMGAKPLIPVFGGPPPVPGFELLGELGRGGMGVVYKARHRRLNRLVALKMVLSGAAADARAVQRFLFEGEVLARVQHPQVVTVYEVGTYDGPNRVPVPYLAMELLEGGSLAQRLRAANAGAAPRLDPRAAAGLVEGLARAVHAAHLQGVVHRDLKPGNILFPGSKHEIPGTKSETDTGPVSDFVPGVSGLPPKVVDFGLAKFTADAGADLTYTGQIVGTPQYMAPEQASGARSPGPPVDIYALGVILFECVAGRPPFAGGDPMSVLLRVAHEPPPDLRALRPDVHRDLAAVVARCLAKEPERRYPSAEALADDLRRFLDGRPTAARPVTAAERAWRAARRNPAVSGLLAALAVALAGVFVAVAALWVRAEERAGAEARERAREAELRREAQDATARAAEEAIQRQRHEARLEFARAVAWCEDGRLADGLRLFVRALELAEATGDAALARTARVNLAAWARDLPPAARPFPHTEQPRLAAFLPDGRHMVTAGRGREAYLWDLADGRKVRAYKAAPSARDLFGAVRGMTYWTVAVSPDGRLIAAGGTDGRVTLWDPDREDVLASLPLPDPGVRGVDPNDLNVWTLAFTADRVLWSNDGANGLRRWDLSDPRKPTSERFLPKDGAADRGLQVLATSPDRRRLYTGSRDGGVREWDAATGAELRRWQTGGWVTDVAVSADGAWAAATGGEAAVAVFDLSPAAPVERRALTIGLGGANGNGVAFAPNGLHVVASDADGNVRCWRRDTGQPVGAARRFRGEVTRMRFRPGADAFAVPAGDAVFLCAAPDPPGHLLSAGRGRRARGLDFAPAGDRLAVADDAGCDLLDLRGGRTRLAGDGTSLAVRFDPDPGRGRVFRGTRNGVGVFAADGKPAPGVRMPGVRFPRVEFPRDGRSVFATTDVAVARYDAASLALAHIKRPTAKLPAGVELGALAVRPDGAEVFVSFGDAAAVLDGDTLDPLREWALGDEVLDARYTPDGSRILLGRRSGAAELRDARSGAVVGAPLPHRGAVTGVAVSADGAVFLTGSRDGAARFWDAATGLPLGGPLRHAGPVTHVALAPGGRHAATATATGQVMRWDLPPAPLPGTVAELRAKFDAQE